MAKSELSGDCAAAVQQTDWMSDMSPLFADPLGRALLTLLTTDHGLPGGPQRRVLLHALQKLRAEAEARNASHAVKGAIRSALWSLRREFPTAYAALPAACSAIQAE